MDERLEKALEFSNYRTTLANQKTNLRNRINTIRTVHYKGSAFTATPTMIAFLSTMIEPDKSLIVEDDKNNPVELENPQELLDQLKSAYHQAMNEYKAENEKIKRARNIKKLMDW